MKFARLRWTWALSFAFVGFAACGGENPAAHTGRSAGPAAPPVTEAAVERIAAAPAARAVGYLGVLVPHQSAAVAAAAAGRLEAVFVRPGDRLLKGAPIARLDAASLARELEQSRATLGETLAAERQATLALADAESRQKRRLSIPESFSKEDLAQAEIQTQQAEAALESARARVAGERARVRQMEIAVGESEIRAPFEGTVAERYLDPGATVGAGTPIVRLVSEGGLIVRFAVPPAEAKSFRLAGPIIASAADLGELPGTIERISPEIDPASRMIFVEARLDGAAPAIQPGAVVRVRRG
ncbi:MAG TPA: efflux RND transporter periplasmic adaptor subunit [Thermoanaerobaculia bacterium]|jgi:RND family efflux transporter MFP subunit|nr:efflux RND transporter periplasmic adaptor subunit [Thermoanaerobaculia bacterium]